MKDIPSVMLAQAYSPYGYRIWGGALLLGFNGAWAIPRMEAYPLGNGHRFYNPYQMRFTTADRLSPFGAGGLNAYCYCLGDPVNRHDPTGKNSVLWRRAMDAYRRSKINIQKLPNEIIEHVLKLLPVKSVPAFARTSRRMNQIASPLLEKSQERFEVKYQKEPDIQHKMVFALRVIDGLEADIHPGAANSLKMTRTEMNNKILESNREHYKAQISAITIRQAEEATRRRNRIHNEVFLNAFAQGFR